MLNPRTVLTRHLATLFPDEESARTIVGLAEIPEGQIDFDGRSLVLWASIVRIAALQEKIPDLLEVARGEFANDQILRDSAELLSRDPHALDIAEEKDSVGAPQQVWTTALVLVGIVVLAASFELPYPAIVAIMIIGLIVVPPALRFLVRKKSGPGPIAPTGKQLADPDRIDLDSGLFGGLAGGIVTGVMLSVVYQQNEPAPLSLPSLMLEVAAFFGVAVAVLGTVVAYLASRFVRKAKQNPRAAWCFNEISASLLAGLGAGALTGIGIAFHFGQFRDQRHFSGPPELLAGILPGCVVVGLFIALWNQRPIAPRLMRSIATSVVAVGLVGLPAVASGALKEWLRHLLYDGGAARLALGGTVYGLLLGAVCGLAIGISLYLSRHWLRRELNG